ncbi:MAG TPA: putative peptidoglycan glycosyltransferase FtsW [Candidatus Saccharimonadales bacterium]|nr:putative peptidoglycan glycosyltransferase FtsW [Candidatus Saccharimonadales bacterium]
MRPSVPSRDRARKTPTLELGRKHRPDYWLVMLCAGLLVVGLIVVYAISPALSASAHVSSNYYVTKQLLAIVLSVVAFAVTANVPLSYWKQAYKPLLIIAALATFIALAMPVNPAYPAHRWVRLGSLSFQSVELVKFAILIAVAGFLAERMRTGLLNDTAKTLKPLLIALLVMGVVIAGPQKLHAQSDLGSMGVIIAMLGTMGFIAGLPMKRILQFVAILAIGVVLVVLPSGYRRERLATYMHPEADCQNAGYQACQALISVGSGGIIGLGLGRSVQAYGYQPEAANDSIFAIYAEKFGFIGCVVLLGLLMSLFGRLKSIAERAPDDFSRLLVVGVLSWFSVQALINIGGMIGVLPLKGITLPFVSYGGTSVIFAAAAVGLAFQVSRYTAFVSPRVSMDTRRRNNYDYSRSGRRLGGAYHPSASGRERA